MTKLWKKLEGGDLRSIGKSNQVVSKILRNPKLFVEVFEGILHSDPLIRMRCADAVEKVTRQHPEYLLPHKKALLNKISKIDQQEVRWHAAQLFPRIAWTPAERQIVIEILQEYLRHESSIVKTFAMQALADIAEIDRLRRPRIVKQLEKLTRNGTPAMQSRGRKLLEKLKCRP